MESTEGTYHPRVHLRATSQSSLILPSTSTSSSPSLTTSCACSRDEATSQVGVFSLASGILGRGEGEETCACSSDENTSSRRKIRVSSLAPGILVHVVEREMHSSPASPGISDLVSLIPQRTFACVSFSFKQSKRRKLALYCYYQAFVQVLYRSHQTTLLPRRTVKASMYEAGVRTQELPGVSLARRNEMTEDSDSPEINEEMKHATLESLQTKPKDQDGSRFWAVLIGVDGDSHYLLNGCVSDAELMEKYLVEDLGVPSNRIQRLLGPIRGETTDGSISPTHANILNTSSIFNDAYHPSAPNTCS
ncbi:hypothetical protein ARMGADRAFT_1078499 [Armillaria gallica]|uniref:Uncharacterized protein n=1 Tax=Armillaria gallica TaxID=47427 RepID=A0A2H3E4J5_ARMGA|nr:hypothetical protein ARMGADRAFT_1078499 [Armillaria gallica]